MKLVITSGGPDLDDPVDPLFGRAHYCLLYDAETHDVTALDNSRQQAAARLAGVRTAEVVVKTGATAVLTGRCGPKAFAHLVDAGVCVFGGIRGTVADAIRAWQADELEQMDCPTDY